MSARYGSPLYPSKAVFGASAYGVGAPAPPPVSANAAATLSNISFAATAALPVVAQAAWTLSPLSFAATAGGVVGASSAVVLDGFGFSSGGSVAGDVIETFVAYATPALFISKYGLAETTQYLADEQRLLTEQLLQDVMTGGWTGTPSAQEKAAARAALSRLNRQLATSSNFMDGYLRAVVSLPLAGGDANATTLEDCCLALARCGLADDCDNSTDKMEAACDNWRKWLKDIATGKVQLVKVDGSVPAPTRGARSGRAASGYDWSAMGGGRS